MQRGIYQRRTHLSNTAPRVQQTPRQPRGVATTARFAGAAADRCCVD